MNQYDSPEFFAAYAQMSRSQFGLEGAGEWHRLCDRGRGGSDAAGAVAQSDAGGNTAAHDAPGSGGKGG